MILLSYDDVYWFSEGCRVLDAQFDAEVVMLKAVTSAETNGNTALP